MRRLFALLALPFAAATAQEPPPPVPLVVPAPPPAPEPVAVALVPPVPMPLLPPRPRPPRRWHGTVQANGSLLFGNTDQRVVGGRSTLTRRDSLLQFDAGAQVLYGDGQTDTGDRQVVKRLWLGSLSVDYRPGMRTSPFVNLTVESSFEKRLALRYSIGAGAKQTFVNTAQREASLSVALLDEMTQPIDQRPGTLVTRVTRWSIRGRLRHTFDDRLRVSHTTFWQPSAHTAADFLVRTNTDAEYALRKGLALSVSLVDNYDSEARARGARVNNDGQLLMGLSARW